MIENYIADLSFGEKRTLKEELQKGFPDGEIELNAMAFLYDADRNMVTVEGLIKGDAIDGLEFLLPDFVALVNEVLADIVLYKTEEEQAAALRTYLADLSPEEKQTFLQRLPKLRSGQEIELDTLEFMFDDERNTVDIEVRVERRKVDELELPLADFLAVVQEVIGDMEAAK